MKEILDIINAYEAALSKGLQAALATVVKVEGSSYRRAGARMLVTEDGQLTGAISGGCLEGDALRRALLAIHQKNNKLITYDTSNPDDLELGVQLGCNGIVHILFEYIDSSAEIQPIHLLKQIPQHRNECVLTTIFSLNKKNHQTGTVGLLSGNQFSMIENQSLSINMLKNFSARAINEKQNVLANSVNEEILMQYISPQTTLVIAGAGNDAQPLVDAATILGWNTIIADGRATHALKKRFPKADEVLHVKAEELIDNISVDAKTVFVLMTHNYQYDLSVLKSIIGLPTPYIGLLGPKTRFKKLMSDLTNECLEVTDSELNKLYGPVGIDIGAETSEEIAISVIAEIKAVLSGKKGSSLRDKPEKMHTDILSI